MLRDERFETIEVTPITGALGAEIRGVDLLNDDDAVIAEVKRALDEYHVLAVRDQGLDPTGLHKVARRFGPFSGNPVHTPMEGFDDVVRFVREPDDTGKVIGEEWHMDLAWLAKPPGITMLFGEVVPPVGGDTCFTSLEKVYDSLSPLRRADIHERLADALLADERYARAHAEIARHLGEAPPTTDIVRRRIERCRLAGDDAMSALAFEAAAAHYASAVDACDAVSDRDATQRCDLLLRTVRAMLARNQPTKATDLAWRAVADARDTQDPMFLATAALLLEEALWIASGFATPATSAEVHRVLREAIDVTTDPATRVELLSRWPRVVHFASDPSERMEPASEAVALAARLEDPRSIAIANDGLRWALRKPIGGIRPTH